MGSRMTNIYPRGYTLLPHGSLAGRNYEILGEEILFHFSILSQVLLTVYDIQQMRDY